MNDDLNRVSYTVKELLAEQREMIRGVHIKIDALTAMIILKADQAALNQLDDRVDKLESRLDREAGRSAYQRYLYPTLIALGCNAVGWALIFTR